MQRLWTVSLDSDLDQVRGVVDFLQGEFCPDGSDPIWSREYFEWKLGLSNPAGKGYIAIAEIDGEIVGTVSLTRKRILVNGEEIEGGEVGDSYSAASARRTSRAKELATDSEPDDYVNKSIFGRLASEVRAKAESDGVSMIYGAPNENAYPGWVKRLGYFDAECTVLPSLFRPTTAYLTNRFPRLSLLSPLLRQFELLEIYLRKVIVLQYMNRELSISPGFPTNEELADLWNAEKPLSGFSLVRDAEYWNHRYIANPLASYDSFRILSEGKFAGVLICRRHRVDNGRTYLSIVEWMVNDSISFDAIIAFVHDHYRNAGVDVFNLWCSASGTEIQSMKRSVYTHRGSKHIVIADTPNAEFLKPGDERFRFYLGSSDAV